MYQPRATRIVTLALLFCVAAVAPAAAQRDAIIAGKITDLAGNPVAGANVEIRSLDRGDVKQLRTNDDGEYLGRGYRPESYLLTISAEGFQPVERHGSALRNSS